FSLALLALTVTNVTARQLEDEDSTNNAEEVEWKDQISGYSMKYNGCLVQQSLDWDSASGHTNTTLVKYKLCPTSSCSDASASGCSSTDYPGEYVIGLTEYVQLAMENQQFQRESYCDGLETEYELALQYDDSQGTNIAVAPTYPSYCEQYENEDTSGTAQERQEQIEKYMEEGCQELGEDANGIAYFVGYACVDDGDKINMAVFVDEYCTSQVSHSVWYDIMGFEWPYGSNNIVSDYCTSCLEDNQDGQDENGDQSAAQDEADADDVIQFCAEAYEGSIKCEKSLLSESETMCSYIDSISMKIQEGHGVSMQGVGGSAGLSFLTAAFSASTIGLAGYVWFLKEKVGRTKIDLGN
ncbi:hypothetical protein TrVE_jg5660, partial [Triparma verrucosa]